MGWAALLISCVSTAVAVFTAWQGARAKSRAEKAEDAARSIEQQKVDAQAFKDAHDAYRYTIKQLRDDNARFEHEIYNLRKMANEDRRHLLAEIKKAQEVEQNLRRRIVKLESALRDSGIPIPNGDHLGGER